MKTGTCYWRFRGEKAYRYGYASAVERGLFRMGLWNGDYTHGPIVDPQDVEVK
jgi:hypothetical protein